MNSESLGRLAQFVIRSAWAAFGATVTDPDTFDTSTCRCGHALDTNVFLYAIERIVI